jgi:hypothetical protein
MKERKEKKDQENRIETLLEDILQEQEATKARLNQLQENVSDPVATVPSISPAVLSIPVWQQDSADSYFVGKIFIFLFSFHNSAPIVHQL